MKKQSLLIVLALAAQTANAENMAIENRMKREELARAKAAQVQPVSKTSANRQAAQGTPFSKYEYAAAGQTTLGLAEAAAGFFLERSAQKDRVNTTSYQTVERTKLLAEAETMDQVVLAKRGEVAELAKTQGPEAAAKIEVLKQEIVSAEARSATLKGLAVEKNIRIIELVNTTSTGRQYIKYALKRAGASVIILDMAGRALVWNSEDPQNIVSPGLNLILNTTGAKEQASEVIEATVKMSQEQAEAIAENARAAKKAAADAAEAAKKVASDAREDLREKTKN